LKLSLNAIKDEKLNLEVFSKVCDAFGPVVPGSTSFLDNIQVTVSNRWFRPDLSQDEAKSYLHGQDGKQSTAAYFVIVIFVLTYLLQFRRWYFRREVLFKDGRAFHSDPSKRWKNPSN
tara:strand:- start:444 stop:797 length:354 start_codon:yes stop_codon:yes gene_type:complete